MEGIDGAEESEEHAGRSGVRSLDGATATLVLVTVAGIAVRIGLWWQDRAFWRDELALIQSLDSYSAAQLVGRLSDAQSAPPLWLLLVRAVTLVAGDGERAYRLVALSAGCATVVVVAFLSAQLVRRRWAAVIPVVLLSTISELVFYTAQTKQYTADTLTVSWLLLLAVRLLRTDVTGDGRGDRRTRFAFFLSLAVLPWVSHGFMLSAPLVAGWVVLCRIRPPRASSVGPTPHRVRIRRGSSTLGLLAGLALPAVSVLAAALHARHLTSQVSDFASYWTDFFGPRGEPLLRWVDWHGFVFRDLAVRELGFATWWGLLLVVAGLVVAVRRQPATGIVLVLPLLTAYAVGVLGMYPFGRRLVLFCVPGLLCYLGVLVDAFAGGVSAAGVGSAVRRRASAVATGVGAVVVLVTCWTTPSRLMHDLNYLYGIDDYRTALAFVATKWQDGDVLVVGNGDRPAVRVYGPRLGLPPEKGLRAIPPDSQATRARCAMPAQITSARRVWLVSGDVVPIYADQPSRYTLIAPLLPRFRSVWHQDRGLVTVQAVMPGSTPNARPARCLDYAPVGPAGDPERPATTLPAS